MTTRARTPLRERLVRGPEHRRARERDHREIDGVGDLVDRSVGSHTGDRLPVAVHGVRRTGEVTFQDVAEELAADRAPPLRGTDHGDGPRLEERPQGGDDRLVVPGLDTLAVPLGRSDRELHLELATLQRAGQLEAGRLEDADHGAVVG